MSYFDELPLHTAGPLIVLIRDRSTTSGMLSLLQRSRDQDNSKQRGNNKKWVWNLLSRVKSHTSETPTAYPNHDGPLSNLNTLAIGRPAKLHRQTRSVSIQRPQLTELEQLALDVRAEKLTWKEAAERRAKVNARPSMKLARKPVPQITLIPDGNVMPQPIGGRSRLQPSTPDDPSSQKKLTMLPSLEEEVETELGPGDVGDPALVLSSPISVWKRYNDDKSDISDMIFADPADLDEGVLSTPPATCRPSLPLALGHIEVTHTGGDEKDYASMSDIVFADPADIDEFEPSPPPTAIPILPEEPVGVVCPSLLPTPTLRRVVGHIERHVRPRPASMFYETSKPNNLDAAVPNGPWHPPLYFESFSSMASRLLHLSYPELDVELAGLTASDDLCWSEEVTPPPSLSLSDHERSGMEEQVADLRIQLDEAVAEIYELLMQLHQTQDELLQVTRESVAQAESLTREVGDLREDAKVMERENEDLKAENKVLHDLINLYSSSVSASVSLKGRPSRHIDISPRHSDSDMTSTSSTMATPQLSNGTTSLPITPVVWPRHSVFEMATPPLSIGSVSLPGTPAQPSFTVQIHDADEHDEELEGLEVDLGDVKQISRLLEENALHAERSLMHEDDPEYDENVAEFEDEEYLLDIPLAEELKKYDKPDLGKGYVHPAHDPPPKIWVDRSRRHLYPDYYTIDEIRDARE